MNTYLSLTPRSAESHLLKHARVEYKQRCLPVCCSVQIQQGTGFLMPLGMPTPACPTARIRALPAPLQCSAMLPMVSLPADAVTRAGTVPGKGFPSAFLLQIGQCSALSGCAFYCRLFPLEIHALLFNPVPGLCSHCCRLVISWDCWGCYLHTADHMS